MGKNRICLKLGSSWLARRVAFWQWRLVVAVTDSVVFKVKIPDLDDIERYKRGRDNPVERFAADRAN